MKKNLLMALVGGAVAIFSSCSTDNGTSTVTYNVPTYNLVTSLDGTGTPAVTQSVYKLDFDLVAKTTTLATEFTAGSNNISFVTDPIAYTGGFYQWNNAYHEIIKFESLKQNNISNITAEVSSMANIPEAIPGLPTISCPVGLKYLVMSYQVGENTQVRTFWSDVTYSGVTSTSYPGPGGINKTYTSEDITYRVVMNPADKKATVIFYNAKFADEMPKPIANIVLKDLPVTFTNHGYKIEGTNITPSIFENGIDVPNTHYVFDNFELNVNGNLTGANIHYKVAGAFTGTFDGSYIKLVPTADGN